MHPPAPEISHNPLPEQYSGQFSASIISSGTYHEIFGQKIKKVEIANDHQKFFYLINRIQE